MSSSLTIEVVEEGTSDLDFLTMTPSNFDFTSDSLPSFSNCIDFCPNPSLLPPIINTFRQETTDNPPTNAAYFSNLSSELLTKQQPKRRVTNNQSFDRRTIDLHPTKNLSSLSHKKSESIGVSNSVPQFSPPTEGVNSVKIPTSGTTTQPQRSKLRRLRKPMNNTKKSSSPTSLPAQTSNLSIDTNTGFDYSQRLKTPSSSSVNSETYPLFPENSNTSQVDQSIDEDDVFLKEEEITEYCSDRVNYSASAFDSYQLEDMDSQDMFDSFTPIILHSEDPFMDDEEVTNAFLYSQPQHNMDTLNGIVIPSPLLMTQPNNPSSLLPHYIPPIQDKSIADKSKKSLRRPSKNKSSQKPILPSNLRNEVFPSLIRVESKETVQSTASDLSESSSQTSIPSRSKSQAIHHSNSGVLIVQTHSKPKQPDNPNKQITFCDSGYELPATKKSTPTPQIQFVSNTPKAPQGISKPCKMSTSSGWKFHNFDREKQPIRDSSGLTYHFYQPKSKIAATTQ